jgi:cysteine desulfurase
MMNQQIYLDNNATTHLSPLVKEKLHDFIEADPANPESAHSAGEIARRYVAQSRMQIAETLNVEEAQVIFTGSGSESNTYAIERLHKFLTDTKRLHVVCSSLEHSSLSKGFESLESRGAKIDYIATDCRGVIDLDDAGAKISKGCDSVVVQWANNETGAIQPVQELSNLARSAGVLFHVDAAQAYGRTRIDLETLCISSLTITGHKLHGPKGIGVLFAEAPRELWPVVYGGQQEYGIRGGTHNMSGIVGMAAAVSERFNHFDSHIGKLCTLRDQFENGVKDLVVGSVVQSFKVDRVPNTTCITFPDADGAALVAWLDAHGVICSQTSACRSRRPEPSEILTAMGLTEKDAYSTIRFSMSVQNTSEEIDRAITIVGRGYKTLTD